MKRKGCLVFIKIGSILLITKGGGIPLASATARPCLPLPPRLVAPPLKPRCSRKYFCYT
jgi:hypothetical protein